MCLQSGKTFAAPQEERATTHTCLHDPMTLLYKFQENTFMNKFGHAEKYLFELEMEAPLTIAFREESTLLTPYTIYNNQQTPSQCRYKFRVTSIILRGGFRPTSNCINPINSCAVSQITSRYSMPLYCISERNLKYVVKLHRACYQVMMKQCIML